jgi:acetyl esterase
MITEKRALRALSAVLVLGAAAKGTAQQTALVPQPPSIQGAVPHIYKSINGVDLRLHAFAPPNHTASSRVPAILFFFGGGWRRGTIEQFVPQSRHFAQRGMVAMVADYRVLDRHRTTPFEAMADARSAVRWVRSRAGELGVDPDRIVAAGGSSGGHIALSAAVFEDLDEPTGGRHISSMPNALVLFNPAVDTSGHERFGDRGREGSPLQHVRSGLPPTLILHGRADTTVPYSEVESFCAESKRMKNDCRVVGYEGAPHGFFNPQNADGKWYREALLEADRFLTDIGYLRMAGRIDSR